MCTLLNFPITSTGKLSQKLLKLGIADFHTAIHYLKALPYGRISNSRNLELLITEQRGTHSLKHAFLAQLARENQMSAIKLVLCSFNMSPENTEAVGRVLNHYGIGSIPEITSLLKYKDTIFDITTQDQLPRAEIISEIEIAPQQISIFKKRYHLNYIENWLQIGKLRHFSVSEIWQIREECIQAIKEKWLRSMEQFC